MPIRPMLLADTLAVCRIEQTCHTKPWTRQHFISSIQVDQSFVFVEGVISGYIIWRDLANQAELLNIAIAPNCQNQGLATKLMLHMLDCCLVNSVETIILEVRESNAVAQHLYRKLGFESIALRANFYTTGFNRNALTMQLRLTQTGI